MLSQLRIQYKLHQLNPDMFPKLFASDLPVSMKYMSKYNKMGFTKTIQFISFRPQNVEIKESNNENWKAGETYLKFHLRPTQALGYDTSDIESKWDMMAEKAEQRQAITTTGRIPLKDIKKSLKNFVDPKMFSVGKYNSVFDEEMDAELVRVFNCMDKNFEIVFLGTGACLPSKYRNVSSTLVNVRQELPKVGITYYNNQSSWFSYYSLL